MRTFFWIFEALKSVSQVNKQYDPLPCKARKKQKNITRLCLCVLSQKKFDVYNRDSILVGLKLLMKIQHNLRKHKKSMDFPILFDKWTMLTKIFNNPIFSPLTPIFHYLEFFQEKIKKKFPSIGNASGTKRLSWSEIKNHTIVKAAI